MTAQIFNYNGAGITFKKGNAVLVNATEMAKQFAKTPKDWLRTLLSKHYISSLSAVRHISPTELVITVQGGVEQGTWMHEDVAMEFARWLSPEFAIWCNDRIKELMKHGLTALPENLDDLINDPDLLIGIATRLKQERAMNEALENENRLLKPKVEFAERVLQAAQLIDIGQAAKILKLPFGRNTLFKQLREKGIFFKERNEPKQMYVDRGLFELKEQFISRTNHEGFVIIKVFVTQKGLSFLSGLFPSDPSPVAVLR